jgi:hypothetical protein
MRRITQTAMLPILIALMIVAASAQAAYAICLGSADLTIAQGEVKTGYLEFRNLEAAPVHVIAKASGSAAPWVVPTIVDFGTLAAGEDKKVENAFKISVPENVTPGSYRIVWSFSYADSSTELECWIYMVQVAQKTDQSSLNTQPYMIEIGLDTQTYLILGAIAAIVILVIVAATLKRKTTPHPPALPLSAAAHKYCIECGSPMLVEAAYCPRCGTKQ